MERIVQTSGLFNGDFTPGRPSRARLDVIRIVFALYCDSVTVYKPILGLIQREYEAHVGQIEEVQSKQKSLEDYLATDQDVFQAQTSAMKARWKQKLKKANEAVFEWKNLYEQLTKEREEENAMAIIGKQAEEISLLKSRIDELEAENTKAIEDNERLAKQAEQTRLQATRMPELEREKNSVKAQLDFITDQLAESKTKQEVQMVHYMTQTREFKQLKIDAANLRKQIQGHESSRSDMTPRPDWRNVASDLSLQLELDCQASTSSLVAFMASNLKKEPHLPPLSARVPEEEIDESIEAAGD
jgi:chromosome segregation ATPase